MNVMCSQINIDEILEKIETISDIKEIRRLLDEIPTCRTYLNLELKNLIEHILTQKSGGTIKR